MPEPPSIPDTVAPTPGGSEALQSEIRRLQSELAGERRLVNRLRAFLFLEGGFLASVVVHLGILALGLVVGREVVNAVETVRREQVIIPDANLVSQADLGGVPNPGLNADPMRASLQNLDPTVNRSDDWAERKREILRATADDGSQTQQAVTPIGEGIRSAGEIAGLSGNAAGGGRLGMFGPGGGGAGLNKGLFNPTARAGGNARKIVYVCDASGSIGTSADRKLVLLTELKRAIDRLGPAQFFNVIFFSDSKPIVLADRQLLQATPDNKRLAHKFLDAVVMQGTTDPIPALEVAFRQKPELLFLLTDGEFYGASSADDVINAVRTLNADKKVAINTIMLDNEREQEHATLRTIADENGGRFTAVTARELLQ